MNQLKSIHFKVSTCSYEEDGLGEDLVKLIQAVDRLTGGAPAAES